LSANTISQSHFQNRAAIAAANVTRDESRKKGWAMTEQQERLARERAAIAARVANFKAMQAKFERERQEYYDATLSDAWDGFRRPLDLSDIP
jgi:hypothetical protein